MSRTRGLVQDKSDHTPYGPLRWPTPCDKQSVESGPGPALGHYVTTLKQDKVFPGTWVTGGPHILEC